MGAQLGLPDALRRRGLTVEVVPGWETRSAGSFNPKGAVCHWTAGPAGTVKRASLNVVTNGRPGLDGPLCNVYLDRTGIAVVVAAGRANHAGAGSWRGLVGNSAVFGTEAEAAGPNDFTDVQRWAYPRVNAAYCDLGGFGPEMVCGHSEWAGARKTDINGYTMDAMRAQVAAILRGEDDMPTPAEYAAAVLSAPIGLRGPDGKLTGEETSLALEIARLRSYLNAVPAEVLAAPIGLRGPDGALTGEETSLQLEAARNAQRVADIEQTIANIGGAGPVDAKAIAEKAAAAFAAKLATMKFLVG